ncbi:type II toxin-antitoxin system HicA family toxin [Rhodoplanes azumiensis]|uniref:Type II toxin-antitoxin system HicA family toxin n=1 Tax=Rhodoplanes azumiensis TaxID=1897628 RepID=A0ABW5AEW4_9BRAD
MRGFGRLVREKLRAAGCYLLRQGRGDHEIWYSPVNDKPFTVPVNIDSRHTANKIMKDAGLPKAF